MSEEKDLIERSWEVFDAVQRKNGLPAPDEVSFVGGFMTCFAMVMGRVPGIPDSFTHLQRLERIQKELEMRRDKALSVMQDNEMRGE